MVRRALLLLWLVAAACHRSPPVSAGPEVVAGPFVASDPPGALVSVDGLPVRRKSPCQIETWDPLVPHLLEVTLPGRVRFHETIEGIPPARIDARLPIEAFVDVDSVPPGAAVSMGGRSVGEAPLRLSVPAGEKQSIVVSRDGYLDGHTEILAAAGAASRYVVELERAATISVDSDPVGASVSIDGADAGVTPVDLRTRAGAEHRIRVASKGLVPCERTVRPSAGSPTTVRCELGDAAERRLRAQLAETERRLAAAKRRASTLNVGPRGETTFEASRRLGIHDRAEDEVEELAKEVDDLQGRLEVHRTELEDRAAGSGP